MTREQIDASLTRMIRTIEAGNLPAPVHALYVLRSAERSSLTDALRVIVLCAPPGPRPIESLEGRVGESADSGLHPLLRAMFPFEHQMRRALVEPGEGIELFLVPRLFDVMSKLGRINRGDLILLWSEADPNYLSKLEELHAPSRRGREPIVPLTRLNDSGGTMEDILDMLGKEELLLARLPGFGIGARLTPYHSHWLSCWNDCKVVDVDTFPLVRHALWWFQQGQQTAEMPHQHEIWSKARTHRAEYGRPSLRRMLSFFERCTGLRQQCLILYPEIGQPNQLLVFERGPNWSRRADPGTS